jgi:hypothetical protein
MLIAIVVVLVIIVIASRNTDSPAPAPVGNTISITSATVKANVDIEVTIESSFAPTGLNNIFTLNYTKNNVAQTAIQKPSGVQGTNTIVIPGLNAGTYVITSVTANDGTAVISSGRFATSKVIVNEIKGVLAEKDSVGNFITVAYETNFIPTGGNLVLIYTKSPSTTPLSLTKTGVTSAGTGSIRLPATGDLTAGEYNNWQITANSDTVNSGPSQLNPITIT